MGIGSLQAKDYQLADHEIRWTGSMPAKTHEGKLTLKSIDADITDAGKVTSLKAVVDMTQINVTDLEGGKRDKLTGHLESDDFFHIEEHSTATFVLDEHKNGKFHGTLTIRGTSKKVALPAKVNGHPARGWMLVGDFDYNRNAFGVDYQNSGLSRSHKSFGATEPRLGTVLCGKSKKRALLPARPSHRKRKAVLASA